MKTLSRCFFLTEPHISVQIIKTDYFEVMKKVFISLIFLFVFLVNSVSAYTTEQVTIGGVSLTLERFTTIGSENWTAPAGVNSINVLIVGGGGGGGHGGGGGGFVQEQTVTVTPGQSYSIVVGAGGIAAVQNIAPGGTGGNSSAFGFTSYGGGGGAEGRSNKCAANSLGPAGGVAYDGNRQNCVNATATQGGDGGRSDGTSYAAAGGGGGAGGNGGDASNAGAGFRGSGSVGGSGGVGLSSSITGTLVCYGGGGGGSANTNGSSATGGTATCGGGLGASANWARGTLGTNGRGGGGGGSEPSRSGFLTTGGSGLVIIRYELDTTAPTLSAVSISSNNSDSSKATPTEVVSLTFTASETIQSPTVMASSGGAAVNGNVSVSNTSGNTWTASFTANANDTAGPVTYRISFSDTAGNAGTPVTTTSDSSSVAVVIDTDLPTLLSSVPSDNAASVKLDKNIILTFSENITAGSGQIKLFNGNDKLVEAFNVSSSIISGATVTLNPTKDLKSDTPYYIQIPSTAFTDAAGNSYAGIKNKTEINFSTRRKTPKEAFTEVKDDIGSDMKANTTKQIRSFATATTAVVTAARGRVLSKRVSSSSRSRGSNRSSGGTRSNSGGGGGSGASGSSGSGGSSSSGTGSDDGTSSDGAGGDNSGGTDSDTESSFDLRSSTRGTNANGQIKSVVTSYDGKVTRYSETQFSYTKSENDAETGSASSQIIFEREKSEDLTVGHFIGFSISKNSTVGTKSTDIESIGLQVGVYFVDNITEDLFVDGYLAGSLLTNKMEVTTAAMSAEADYVSRMGAAGAAVTGSFDFDRWEILPTLALDYSNVSSQDASFEVTFGGGNSNELSSPGSIKQLSLTFSPDFRTSFDYYDGYWAQGSTFSLKPKFTCQRINQGTITRECGQGAALSMITQDENAMQTLSFTLGVDKISSDTTYSANALYKFEF